MRKRIRFVLAIRPVPPGKSNFLHGISHPVIPGQESYQLIFGHTAHTSLPEANTLPATLTIHIALRARKYDVYAREFLKQHPRGIVVNMGCGFDTRYWRIGARPEQYLEIDLPEVIKAKQQLLAEAAEYLLLGYSVPDHHMYHILPELSLTSD